MPSTAMHFADRLADWLIPISFTQAFKDLLDPFHKFAQEVHLDEAIRMDEQ